MIKSLSPYYLNIPFVSPLTGATCSKYTLNIYIWNGLKSAVLTTPLYSVTKNNPTTSTGTDKINISRLVNDYINFMPEVGTATGLVNANNQRWCKTSIVYTTENALDFEVEQLITTTLVLKGYNYGMEGENAQPPANRILLSGTEFKVNRNGVFNIPIILDMTILERLEALEVQATETALITSVFVPDGAMIAWNKPANTIPTGWAEVTDFAGKTLFGFNSGDASFDTLGETGGAKTVTLTNANMPSRDIRDLSAGAIFTADILNTNGAVTGTSVGATAVNILNPYRVVHFIEYIG